MSQSAVEIISSVFQSTTEVPFYPEMVRLMMDPSREATLRELTEVVELDHGMATRVLRLANSSFYPLKARIASLPHACNLLGARTLMGISPNDAVADIFFSDCAEFDRKAFWKHSVATALAAREICSIAAPGTEDDLYATGLLCSVGVLLLARHIPEDYSQVLRVARENESNLTCVEREAFGFNHREVTCQMVERWRLPPLVSRTLAAMRTHRGDGISYDCESPAVEIVAFAETWARRAGLYFLPVGAECPAQPPAWIQQGILNLDEILASVLKQVETLYRRFFPAASKDAVSAAVTELES